MSESDRRVLPWRAFVVGLVLALGVGYALRPSADRGAQPAGPALPASQDPSGAAGPLAGSGAAPSAPEPAPANRIPAPTEAAKAANPSLEKPLAPFATLNLSRADFPASGTVTVKVDLGAPSADDKPRTVRMFSQTDQRGILTDARLDETRTVGTIQLDPNFLQPGEYFVEVTTTERSAFPVRRYAIVVR
jgi:hypothetical protein